MVLDADTFVMAVDRHITPSMVRLGYNRLPTSTGTSSTASLLVSQPRWRRRLPWLGETATGGRLAVGYEAADVDVARQLEPDDPVHFDELWTSYYPASGTLDLS
jgi:hypothetical protein